VPGEESGEKRLTFELFPTFLTRHRNSQPRDFS